jgi:hypothetical protein
MDKWEPKRDLIFSTIEFNMDMAVRICIDRIFADHFAMASSTRAYLRINNITWLDFPSKFYD